MATFYILYVIAGGGGMQTAWGGPAILRFDNLTTCESAATAMRSRKHVWNVECVPVSAAK